jgi:hypothetical protein
LIVDRSPLTVRTAACIAGLVYAFSPYHFAHLLGHLQLIALQWIPFYVLYLLRALDRATAPDGQHAKLRALVRDALVAGLFLVLVGLCDWYYAMYCLFFTALALLVYLLRRRLTWRGLAVVAGAGVFFLAMLSPLLLPMVQGARSGAWSNASLLRDYGETLTLSADLVAFVTPQVFHPLWGDWALARSASFTATPSEYTVFAGFTVLILACIALMTIRKPESPQRCGGRRGQHETTREKRLHGGSPPSRPWFWVLAAGVFALLALGPVLHAGGRTDLLPGGGQIPLPYALLYDLVPFMKLSRSVSRLDVMSMLALGVAAAFGVVGVVEWMVGRWGEGAGRRAGWVRRAVPALVAGMVLFEFLPLPFPTNPPDTPGWYAGLAKAPGVEPVLNLPADFERPGYLLYQTVHGQPMATGYVTRDDPNTLRERAPVLSHFFWLGPDIHTADFDLNRQGMQVLHDLLGLRWVVLDRYKMPEGPEREVTEAYAAQIFGDQPPAYGDQRLTVYEVGEPLTRGPYLILRPGWPSRESDAAGRVWRSLPAGHEAGLDVVNPGGQALVLAVVAGAPAGGTLRLLDGDGRALARWDTSAGPVVLRSDSLSAAVVAAGLRLAYDGPPAAAAAIYQVMVEPSS